MENPPSITDLFISLLSQVALNRKVEVIIDVFLDSATPPWLQVSNIYERKSLVYMPASVLLFLDTKQM